MKRIRGDKVCFAVSALLFLAFIVHTIVDYSRYNATLNSAPFSLWILVNAIYFIVPAAVALVIGLIIRKKTRNA